MVIQFIVKVQIKNVFSSKKDINGKNVFKTETGKFLNCDQFWKNLGGKTSYAKIQDDYNKFITEKCYNLFRGVIVDNKHHKTKAEKEIDDLNDKIKEMKTTKEISKIYSKDILNPVKRKVRLFRCC